MIIYLIRHGKTQGNLEGRYIGTTDEPLLLTENDQLASQGQKLFGEQQIRPESVYVSPLLRCRQTAEVLFPDMPQCVVDDLRECDFGDFENRNYKELSDNPLYQKWIDSNGMMPFPNGESRQSFQDRCVKAFVKIVRDAGRSGKQCIAMVVHGGTIMSIMERVGCPGGSYYDFQVKNGCGFCLMGNSCEEGFIWEKI